MSGQGAADDWPPRPRSGGRPNSGPPSAPHGRHFQFCSPPSQPRVPPSLAALALSVSAQAPSRLRPLRSKRSLEVRTRWSLPGSWHASWAPRARGYSPARDPQELPRSTPRVYPGLYARTRRPSRPLSKVWGDRAHLASEDAPTYLPGWERFAERVSTGVFGLPCAPRGSGLARRERVGSGGSGALCSPPPRLGAWRWFMG